MMGFSLSTQWCVFFMRSGTVSTFVTQLLRGAIAINTSVNTQEKCWYTIWYFWEFNCVVQVYLCSRVGALTVNKNKPLIKSWLTRINQHESRNLNLCYWLTQNETTKLSDFVIIPYELSWYQHLNKVYKILIIFFIFLLEKLVNMAWLLE